MSDRICTNCNGETASGCHLCNPFAIPTGIVAECLDCKAKDKRIEVLKVLFGMTDPINHVMQENETLKQRLEAAEAVVEATHQVCPDKHPYLFSTAMPIECSECRLKAVEGLRELFNELCQREKDEVSTQYVVDRMELFFGEGQEKGDG